MPALAADPRFQTNALRMQNREELVRLLTDRLVTRTTAEWMEQFDAVGLPAGPVLDIPEALAHPQAQAREMIVETSHPTAGPVKGLGLPIRFSNGRDNSLRPAPLLGQHTHEVLLELGYSEQDVQRLREENAVLVRG
jgi:formyl-CoA transferase